MPRSLANGDYSLLMAVESSSRADSWYRVLGDRVSGRFSCDCPPWTFKQDPEASDDERSCQHTRFCVQLAMQPASGMRAQVATFPVGFNPLMLIDATQRQWPGLQGQWSVETRLAQINNKFYTVILLKLHMGNGGVATGVIAFAERHRSTAQQLLSRTSMWCGFAIAAEVARLGGFPMAGQPPDHFRVNHASASGGRARRASTGVGLTDILRTVGDQVDLGDGLRPIQRAENTLRLFMGETLYQQLERQGFLDISSTHYPDRVYRMRRDPEKQRERRLRVFQRGRYWKDFCIVRNQDVPEADFFLSTFLSLLSDEMGTISVVKDYNVFGPHSDDYYHHDEETVPAVWQARTIV